MRLRVLQAPALAAALATVGAPCPGSAQPPAAPLRQAPVSGPRPADAERVALVDAVVASTTAEWSAIFESQGRSYRPPRVIHLRAPIGHPGRGSGYHPTAGLTVDLGDVEAFGDVFGAEAKTLIALMIAHEVGHHVQGPSRAGPDGSSAPGREQQADCYAGWWLGRANARSQLSLGRPVYPLPNLDRRFPEALQLLSVTSGGRLFAQSDRKTHGHHLERVAAIRRGLSAGHPSACASPAGEG